VTPVQSGSLSWIQRISAASVLLVAMIAAVVSFRHMHQLALRHGESTLTAALIPLSVDGTVISSSLALLAENRQGRRGGLLPWTLLIVASLASLAANVAIAEPTWIGRVIAAWPSFALVGAYETLMRQIRLASQHRNQDDRAVTPAGTPMEVSHGLAGEWRPVHVGGSTPHVGGRELQRAAWQWALANQRPDGGLPSGASISQAFSRSPRWGRLVKRTGLAGRLDTATGG
jgi:hypothetical protein